jgi:hypothetical protein
MAAKQNVFGAIKGGPAALVAGALAVAVCFAFVPVISRIGGDAPGGDAPQGGVPEGDER